MGAYASCDDARARAGPLAYDGARIAAACRFTSVSGDDFINISWHASRESFAFVTKCCRDFFIIFRYLSISCDSRRCRLRRGFDDTCICAVTAVFLFFASHDAFDISRSSTRGCLRT